MEFQDTGLTGINEPSRRAKVGEFEFMLHPMGRNGPLGAVVSGVQWQVCVPIEGDNVTHQVLAHGDADGERDAAEKIRAAMGTILNHYIEHAETKKDRKRYRRLAKEI